MANTPDYKGKSFRSISRGDVDLTAIKSADGKDTDDDQKNTDETKSADTAVAKIKDVLSARVATRALNTSLILATAVSADLVSSVFF